MFKCNTIKASPRASHWRGMAKVTAWAGGAGRGSVNPSSL